MYTKNTIIILSGIGMHSPCMNRYQALLLSLSLSYSVNLMENSFFLEGKTSLISLSKSER